MLQKTHWNLLCEGMFVHHCHQNSQYPLHLKVGLPALTRVKDCAGRQPMLSSRYQSSDWIALGALSSGLESHATQWHRGFVTYPTEEPLVVSSNFSKSIT